MPDGAAQAMKKVKEMAISTWSTTNTSVGFSSQLMHALSTATVNGMQLSHFVSFANARATA
jgi:hypothetical protein